MKVHRIFISPGHNYWGRDAVGPDNHPLVEVDQIECLAHHGLRGDRFCDYKSDYEGQVTFFSQDVFDDLCLDLGLNDKSPGAMRRNVIVSDIDLNSLIGKDFCLQDIHFRGMSHCAPCGWMDVALAPGAYAQLKKVRGGGLRAQILSDGVLRSGAARLTLA